MKSFSFVPAAIAVCIGTSAQAGEISCISKYFMREEVKVRLTIQTASELELYDATLTLGDQLVRKGTDLQGRIYSGRKYKHMVAFPLEGENVVQGKNDWQQHSMGLLLPAGHSGYHVGQRFKAIITETASDGGSYNEVLCTAR